ncbi:MAG: hypothetical protein M1828_006347 [Chrysothrix sp. TS-e1954]|nr:MAG: hypothetical protein M1828_006347 [Chrysothrix sp. TS-e1954]
MPTTLIQAAPANPSRNPRPLRSPRHSSRTRAVDKEAAIRTWDAVASAARVLEGRDPGKTVMLIVISAADVRERSKADPEWYTAEDLGRSARLWDVIGVYMRGKLEADSDLRARNGERRLRYTILRPGGLTDEVGKGRVSAGKVGTGKTVSRADVAGVVVECMKEGVRVEGRAFDIMGGDVGIEQAVRDVVEGDVDTFRGYEL